MLTTTKNMLLAMFVMSLLFVTSLPLMADGTVYSCSQCSSQASPPYFEGPATYSVVDVQTKQVVYSKTFNSLSTCQQARSADFYCTNRPPVSSDH